MSKTVLITLSDHFQHLITNQVEAGHYASASEVVAAAMQLFEERANQLEFLRSELRKGELGEGITIEDYQRNRSQHEILSA